MRCSYLSQNGTIGGHTMNKKSISLKYKAYQFTLSLMNSKMKFLFFIEIVLLLLVSFLPSIIVYYEMELFNYIGIEDKELLSIFKIIFLIVIVNIIACIIDMVFDHVKYNFNEKFRLSFKKSIFIKINRIEVGVVDDPNFYDVLSRIKEDGSNQMMGNLTGWFELGKDLIRVISLSLVLIRIHWIFPIINIALSIPYIILFRKMNYNHYFTIMNNSKKTRKNHYIIDLLTKREYRKEVQLFGLYDYLYQYHEKMRDELFFETYTLVKKYTIYAGIISIAKRFVQVLCLGLGIYFVYNNYIELGMYAILVQTVSQIQSYLLSATDNYKALHNHKYHLNDIWAFFQLPEVKSNQNQLTTSLRDEGDLIIENLNFTYPHTEVLVLKNISIRIPAGQKVAIVGENGSGKSTFAYLLSGLFQPTSGSIIYDGKNIQAITREYQSKVGFIFQDFIRLKGTIRDNLLIGTKNDLENEQIIEALKVAGAWEFVQQLPNGIDTKLGFIEDGSIDLSGGQWQKIAIARSLLDKDKSILILDEFAAALDPFSESSLYERFHELTNRKTSISISHRLGITRMLDRILVFHDGNIIEDGTHQSLMQKHGTYYNMYMKQRKLYEGDDQCTWRQKTI